MRRVDKLSNSTAYSAELLLIQAITSARFPHRIAATEEGKALVATMLEALKERRI